MTTILHNTNSSAKMTFPSRWLYFTEAKATYHTYTLVCVYLFFKRACKRSSCAAIYYMNRTLCKRMAKALVRLCICTGSSELSLIYRSMVYWLILCRSYVRHIKRPNFNICKTGYSRPGYALVTSDIPIPTTARVRDGLILL